MAQPLSEPAFTLRRLPVLDGLRAVAIIGVLVSHYNLTTHLQPVTRGGILGVDVFFVLSGFLITSLLIDEIATTGRLALRVFYTRRALRLFPALFTMVAVTLVALRLDDRLPGSTHTTLPFHDLLREVIPVLTYWDNWFRAFSLGPATPLSHAWSLSIEEQFYVVWPIVLVLLLRAGGYRLALWFAALGVAASSIARAVEYHGTRSYASVYFSTHTRASDLLFGCALAILLALGLSKPAERALRLLLLPALATCAVFLTYLGRIDTPFLYRAGLLVFGFATAVVMGNLVTRRLPVLTPVLACVPMVYIGRISYGLYLWLRPVEWVAGTRLSPHETMLIGLPATFALAALSYAVIERPFLRLKDRFGQAVTTNVQESVPLAT